jgi:tRNA-modifying protein YgfZ
VIDRVPDCHNAAPFGQTRMLEMSIEMRSVISGRSLISVSGPDAQAWLQNLITADIDAQPAESANGAALLTPQGKILFDFLVMKDAEGALNLDMRSDQAAALAQRLTFYRLRAKVEIGMPRDTSIQVASTGDVRDLRFSVPVFRSNTANAPVDAAPFDALRIANGVAESGSDYVLGDAFPHDINLDQTGGVGFRKGCYVGQEVISRMQHRGTARRRIVIAEGESDLPLAFTPLVSAGREIGHLGTVQGRSALAMLRLDRLADAAKAGNTVTADGVAMTFRLPPGATFPLHPEAGSDA